MKHAVRILPTFCALVVAVASFCLSYVALRDVSASVHAVPADMAWVVPIVVDGGVIAASSCLWASSYRNRRRDPIAYLVTTALLIFSVIVNTYHAGSLPLAKAIAALPPLTLLACLELVAKMHRADLGATQVAAPATVAVAATHVAVGPSSPPAVAKAITAQPESTQPSAPAAPAAAGAASTSSAPAAEDTTAPARKSTQAAGGAEKVRQLFDEAVLAGRDPGERTLAKEIADQVDVSAAYVRKIIRPLRETTLRPSSALLPVTQQ